MKMLSNPLLTVLDAIIRRRLFQPDQIKAMEVDVGGMHFQIVEVRSSVGTLRGLSSTRPANSMGTVLFLHGNGGCAANRVSLVAPLYHCGFKVVVADYRGYGCNVGRPTMTGLVDDCCAWLKYAETLGDPVVILGHSLGGTLAATLLGAGGRPKGIVTFGAMAALECMMPRMLARWASDQFDVRPVAERSKLPWVVIHADDDAVVPFANARAIVGAGINNPNVASLPLKTGGHVLNTVSVACALQQILETWRDM